MIALNLCLTVFCKACNRSVDVDLTKLPPHGRSIGATFRCERCGEPGSSVVYHASALRAVPGRRPKKV